MASNAATRLFAIPELLELILLALPRETTYEEIATTRFTLLSRTVCRTWHNLIASSTPLRQALYVSNPISTEAARTAWTEETAFPPAQPNPWIPFLLLNQRSWGSAYPLQTSGVDLSRCEGSRPRLWTFMLEISRSQVARFPLSGPWREMLVAEPPIREFWYTRSFYELGSGRAPFVTHLDYDPKLPKANQKYRKHRTEGVTLGMIVDAVGELFDMDREARFVMVESLAGAKAGKGEAMVDLSKHRPTTRSYVPGSSAEKAHGWVRGV